MNVLDGTTSPPVRTLPTWLRQPEPPVNPTAPNATETFLEERLDRLSAPSRSWRRNYTVSEIGARARRYGFNPDRAFFPVNSLRLLYFLLSDALTNENEAARSAITEVVPQVDALITAWQRDGGASRTTSKSLEAVYEIIDSPVLRQFLEDFIGSGLPRQRELLAELTRELQSTPPTPLHLARLLEARSIDSYALSAILHEIAKKYRDPELTDVPSDETLLSVLHSQINRAYQLNDLVDAVIFAKDELESEALSPMQLLLHIAPHPQVAKVTAQKLLERLIMREQLSSSDIFYKMLKDVVTI